MVILIRFLAFPPELMSYTEQILAWIYQEAWVAVSHNTNTFRKPELSMTICSIKPQCWIQRAFGHSVYMIKHQLYDQTARSLGVLWAPPPPLTNPGQSPGRGPGSKTHRENLCSGLDRTPWNTTFQYISTVKTRPLNQNDQNQKYMVILWGFRKACNN